MSNCKDKCLPEEANRRIPVLDYVDENVSTKVVKIISAITPAAASKAAP